MSEATPQVVRSYVAELDSALQGIPQNVRDEILAGVREELGGLDASAAATRIEELGDPAFIAAEAQAETGATAPAPPASGAFEVIASLLVAFGGFVIPVAGWLVGLAMVWMSHSWHRWEKVSATLAVPAWIAVSAVVSWLFARDTSISIFGFGTWHVLIIATLLVPVASGLWLLWRARRTARPRA